MVISDTPLSDVAKQLGASVAMFYRRHGTDQVEEGEMFAEMMTTALLLVAQADGDPHQQTGVEAFLESYGQALSECDADLLRGLLAEDFSGFGFRGVLGRGRNETADQFREICVNRAPMTVHFVLEDFDVAGDALIVAAIGLSTSDDLSPDETMAFRASFVLIPEGDDGWRVLHSHLSPSITAVTLQEN